MVSNYLDIPKTVKYDPLVRSQWLYLRITTPISWLSICLSRLGPNNRIRLAIGFQTPLILILLFSALSAILHTLCDICAMFCHSNSLIYIYNTTLLPFCQDSIAIKLLSVSNILMYPAMFSRKVSWAPILFGS